VGRGISWRASVPRWGDSRAIRGLVDGVQVHKVMTVSQSKSGNVWIYSTVYTGYTWSPLTWCDGYAVGENVGVAVGAAVGSALGEIVVGARLGAAAVQISPASASLHPPLCMKSGVSVMGVGVVTVRYTHVTCPCKSCRELAKSPRPSLGHRIQRI
jgi:hypothetical protein